jgi:hypothetical protein
MSPPLESVAQANPLVARTIAARKNPEISAVARDVRCIIITIAGMAASWKVTLPA